MLPQDRLLRRGRALLGAARSGAAAWDELRFDEAAPAEAHEQRARAREQLAWALQLDYAEADDALIRFVLTQELAWRRVAPYAGVGETIELLGWMLARRRQVSDVWLFAQIKEANFDTACGFDREHAMSGGVAATLAYVRANQAQVPAEILALTLGVLLDDQEQPRVDEERITAWIASRTRRFVTRMEDVDLAWWLARALAYQDNDAARELLVQWRALYPEELVELAGYLRDLGEHDEEAEVRAALVVSANGVFERAGRLRQACQAARRARLWDRALDHLVRASRLHQRHPDWRQLGLGRSFVEEGFELAAQASEVGLAGAHVAEVAFAVAHRFARKTPRLGSVVAELAARAARTLGRTAAVARYESKLAGARARHEAELRSIREAGARSGPSPSAGDD